MRLLAALLLAAPASAGVLEAEVVDRGGDPVEDALVFVVEAPGDFAPPEEPYVMDQVDLQFEPRLLPVLKGGRVRFPNRDQVHHHLYSFSDAKKFELPLYKEKPTEPIVFDSTGVVKLGCNIHDSMSGAVVVLQNPHFARTGADGRAVLDGLPEGAPLTFGVFHHRQRGGADRTFRERTPGEEAIAEKWKIRLRRERKRKRRNPYGFGDD